MTAMATLAVIAAVMLIVGVWSIRRFVHEHRRYSDPTWALLTLGVAALMFGVIWMIPPAITLWDALQ